MYTLAVCYIYFVYTLREFRANTKKAFDDASAGHEVVIKRGKENFQLVSLVSLPLGGSSFESTPKDIKPIIELTPEFIPKKRLENGVCKIHAMPLDNRSRCLQKGCKYS